MSEVEEMRTADRAWYLHRLKDQKQKENDAAAERRRRQKG